MYRHCTAMPPRPAPPCVRHLQREPREVRGHDADVRCQRAHQRSLQRAQGPAADAQPPQRRHQVAAVLVGGGGGRRGWGVVVGAVCVNVCVCALRACVFVGRGGGVKRKGAKC